MLYLSDYKKDRCQSTGLTNSPSKKINHNINKQINTIIWNKKIFYSVHYLQILKRCFIVVTWYVRPFQANPTLPPFDQHLPSLPIFCLAVLKISYRSGDSSSAITNFVPFNCLLLLKISFRLFTLLKCSSTGLFTLLSAFFFCRSDSRR